MAYYVIDRIEGKTAVIVADDGRTFDVPRRQLPKRCREGTVLRIDAEGRGSPEWARAVIDEPERQRRLNQARETLRRLAEGDRGQDIDL